MSKFSRIQVIQKMTESGLVPLFYHSNLAVAKAVTKACYDGGARALEFTNRGEDAHMVFGDLCRYVHQELPDMALGIGSVIDGGTAALFLQLGADFVVTPSFREDVVRVCNRRKILWSAGCFTPTEIGIAEEWGCEIVKIFPGDALGPAFVKAIKGPSPWTSIMPTGGVSPDEANLKAWFDAGVTCVGMGSQLIGKSVLEMHDYVGLEHLVHQTIDRIARLKA
ncbi:MAG TPA: bifunctional 4-hydroxy-2-oxoglutarate aldolase/2-dehydro-3-deoxy-phosphogluconate aldolase [Saprospiraceae bacterium]|nr:bifunctional 4-hydroxy-2-oxoglutarate aldolase/2-dehydro-3-deoxy-phosphogluconate aldolase [Saprospiraceae bacterium]HMQ81432.1 bifunctional 4-hydroxy-2-oxoglutarate aldolase/2-dehydro-3-deoxy-phosphogluconate aldolase [Saprospiraceae bacterium]